MRVKLFTHTDLDGVSCSILGKLAFGHNIHIEHCDYNNINERIGRFIEKDLAKYDRVYITDISVNEEVAETIDALEKYVGHKFVLLDHHETAIWLNKYEWVTVEIENKKGKTCGTSLFFNHLYTDMKLVTNIEKIKRYVELVRRYDTWEWSDIYNDYKAKELNDLLYIYGADYFIEKYADILTQFNNNMFDLVDDLLLSIRQKEIDRYIKKKQKQILIITKNEFTFGVVFADKYQSELGNELIKMNPRLDFIAMINLDTKKVSYRSDSVNVSKFAEKYGGGGHEKASGSQIGEKKVLEIIDIIFS